MCRSLVKAWGSAVRVDCYRRKVVLTVLIEPLSVAAWVIVDHVVRPCTWWSRTSAAAVIAPIRQGHRLTRRSALKVVLSRELPRSASARVAACKGVDGALVVA